MAMQPTNLYVPYSYTPAAPTTRRSSILGPLRKRQYQTRQQQIRYGTNTRIGASPHQRDEHPLTGYFIRCEAHSHPALDQQLPLTASCSSNTQSMPSSTPSDVPMLPPSPRSLRPRSSSPSVLSSSSTVSSPLPPHSAPGRPTSGPYSQPQQHRDSLSARPSSSSASSSSPSPSTVTKGIMMVGQAMGLCGSAASSCGPGSLLSSSISCSSSLASSVCSSSDPSLGLRRMSSPSLSAAYKMDGARLSTSSTSSSSSSSTSYTPSTLSSRSGYVYVSSVASVHSIESIEPLSTSSSSDAEGESYSTEYGRISPVHVAELASQRLPLIMRERECTLEGFDKVFALTWLTDEDILLGTKCNYLMHLNTRTNRRVMLGQLGESLTWTTDEVQHHLRGYERQGAKKPIGGGSGAQGSEASRASNYHQYQQQQQQRPSSYASILSRASSGAQSTTGNGLERVTSNLGLRLFSAGRRSSTPSGIGSADLANNLSSLAIQGTFNNIQGIGVTNNSATATTATATTTNGSGVTAPLGVDHYSQQYLNPMSGGIRSIVINPSRSMVAIGAGEPYYVAIYALPEFEPIGLLHGHSDLVFSLRWVSDTVLVSASRDGSLRVWSLEAEPFTQLPSFLQPINVWKDVLTREEEKVKVRDLAYNRRSEQLMTLNTDGYVKLWDRESYQRVSKIKLVHYSEAVCLAVNPYVNLYAVGSQAHISILDPRTASAVHVMDSCDEGWGVRSLDFKSHIVTTGGGYGRLGFYDLRAQRYLDGFDQGTSNKRYRDIGYGWLNRETAMAGGMAGLPVRNAIYAMEYDDTGTRLFTAGGPLQLGLCGSYAALWS